MRFKKLVPALAVAAGVLALVPASAAALRHHRGLRNAALSGRCHLTLEGPQVIYVGEGLTLQGRLICPSAAAVAGAQVKIVATSTHRRPTSAVVGTTTTEGGEGVFHFTPSPAPTITTLYTVHVRGAKGAQLLVHVRPTLTLTPPTPADGTQLLTGAGEVVGVPHIINPKSHIVLFTGTVSPSYTGRKVVLQREASSSTEEWRAIDTGSVNSNHEFTIAHIFRVPGDANIRVVAPRTNVNGPGATETRSYVIEQPQNPNLTINVSSNPISEGQSVEITGIAKGVANGTVTLMARTSASPKPAPVASVKTDSGGNYKFTQTPATNTFYHVTDATASSSLVFEGVRYVLTPISQPAPSTSVQAGVALTFTGTVSPNHAGHAIYLERGFGVGYAVAEVSHVNAKGEYSLSHAFFTPGSFKVRVKIPGDPENVGSSTPPVLKITITPPPPGTLRPVLPIREPKEGQL